MDIGVLGMFLPAAAGFYWKVFRAFFTFQSQLGFHLVNSHLSDADAYLWKRHFLGLDPFCFGATTSMLLRSAGRDSSRVLLKERELLADAADMAKFSIVDLGKWPRTSSVALRTFSGIRCMFL